MLRFIIFVAFSGSFFISFAVLYSGCATISQCIIHLTSTVDGYLGHFLFAANVINTIVNNTWCCLSFLFQTFWWVCGGVLLWF